MEPGDGNLSCLTKASDFIWLAKKHPWEICSNSQTCPALLHSILLTCVKRCHMQRTVLAPKMRTQRWMRLESCPWAQSTGVMLWNLNLLYFLLSSSCSCTHITKGLWQTHLSLICKPFTAQLDPLRDLLPIETVDRSYTVWKWLIVGISELIIENELAQGLLIRTCEAKGKNSPSQPFSTDSWSMRESLALFC